MPAASVLSPLATAPAAACALDYVTLIRAMQDADARAVPVRQSRRRGALGAILLIALGLFFLLNNLVGDLDRWFLLVLGLAFLVAHLSGRRAAVPAGILTGLGAGVALEQSAPGSFQGLFLLAPLGLGFFLVWVLDRHHRWAFWPAGLLVAIGLLSMLAEVREIQRLWLQATQLWPVLLVAAGAWLLWRQYAPRR